VAVLGGERTVVVGDRAGYLYAFSLANGGVVPGWPASTGGTPIDSTPSVAPLDRRSPDDTIFVGVGDAATPHRGGYEAFDPDGRRRWYVRVKNPATDLAAKKTSAVRASLAVGDLQGTTDVVAPSVGQEEYAINAATGRVLRGFPWFTSDSGFTTPALADLYGNGRTEIVEGGSQTAGLANWVQYSQGGHLRVIAATGTAGTGSPTGGLICEYNANQVVESSPAVGPFLGGGSLGIAVGTGTYFRGAPETDKLLAFGTHCNLEWQASLDGSTSSSPALATVAGNGTFAVLEGTDNGHGGGSVYALAGSTGRVLWRHGVSGEVIGGVVTADVGRGDQLIVAPTTDGAQILDGRNGHLVATLARGIGLQNSPLITDDPNGFIGITVAGYDAHDQGVIEHFELSGLSGSHVDAYGAWPMFHHDPQLTGDAMPPGAAALTAHSLARPPKARCAVARGRPNGYYEVDSKGDVFAFGNVASCGSLAGRQRALPIVGMAAARNGGGYWLVNSAGEVFTFGDAGFYGPRTDLFAKSPIAGMAVTPDGRGYWLVAQNGQVYAFGDAEFHGPRKRLVLPAPIAAMASTGDGRGYWLVASDGAILTFGDAVAHSSVVDVRPHSIIGIATDTATGGYWLVSAGGVVFAFDAPTYGSIAGYGIADAMTGIQALPGGSGYRLVDTGGELFCYGLATDLGTASATGPTHPVVAIAEP
ncbi:MAG TPA: hypothetical protein VEJ84_07250, partial [Acidimicrobiales bacterium]|nr:hypothetical protein [Acidimicrobiales bacterium]